MAQTVTITAFEAEQPGTVGQDGRQSFRHLIKFINQSGQEVPRYIFEGTPLYNQLAQKPLVVGNQYDIQQTQNGKYWNISSIAAPGSMPVYNGGAPKTPYNKPAGKPAYTPKAAAPANPDKELSMEMGGLMHDAATLVAAGKRTSIEATAIELYLLKQKITASIKSGAINQPAAPAVVKVEEPKHQTIEATTAELDDSFPY